MKWIHSFKSEIDTGITSQTTQNMITYLTNSQYNLTPEQTYKAKTALAQTIIEAANFHIETEIDYSSTPENYIFKYDIVNQAYTQYTLKIHITDRLVFSVQSIVLIIRMTSFQNKRYKQ